MPQVFASQRVGGESLPHRVALCITELDVGGAERALVDLATRLDRKRFEPTVYCLGPRPVDEAASCAAPLDAAGVACHCLGATRKRHIFYAIGRLRKLFLEHRPSIVQTFLFHGNIVGRIAAHRAGIRNVAAGVRVAEREARWHLWLDRWTGSLVRRHVCVSRSVARFTRERVGHPENRLSVIPNGIDPAAYPAQARADFAPLGMEGGRKVMTAVGRLVPQKGIDWLLETMPRWKDRANAWDLLLVGEGPERKRLEDIVRRLGLVGRVFFAGWRPDVSEILAASDLFVLPSRWEGMPNVLLQAMATGLPVLATDVEGVREVLGPQAATQMCPFGEPMQWTTRLLRMTALRPEQRAALGNANRRRVVEHFAIQQTVEAYQRLWSEMLAT